MKPDEVAGQKLPPNLSVIFQRALSLSTVSQVQSACRAKPLEVKKELLCSVEGKSRRQVEKIIAAVFPMPVLPERRCALDDKQTEVRFVVSERLDQKLERIKALTSHKKFNPSYAELIEMMADMVLDRIDPEKKKKKAPTTVDAAANTPAPPPAEVAPKQVPIPTRYVPVGIKRALFSRAGARCEYVHPTVCAWRRDGRVEFGGALRHPQPASRDTGRIRRFQKNCRQKI